MRVFCHEHKRGFFAPRQSPIKCENSGHILGELDFAGQLAGGKSSFSFQWQYCCNCEHFCVIDFDDSGLQRCPVCTRRSSGFYLCDRCYTVSFESNTPLETKNFTLTSDGTPSPCCPGCLQPAAADLREHVCDAAQVSLVTALNTCPICDERLDVGPAFPSPVAQYLRRTKSANKTPITFDYETGLFVPVEDGEFVLIRNHDETNKTFVLPRSPQLASLRDFYELYQDYYHCAAPATGDIHIQEPAVVVPMSQGWKLLTPGIFLIVGQPPKKRIPEPVPQQPAPQPVRQPLTSELVAKSLESDGSSLTRQIHSAEPTVECTYCDTPIEAKYAFCWKCGSARPAKPVHSKFEEDNSLKGSLRPPRSRLIVSAIEEDEEEARTIQPRSEGLSLKANGRSYEGSWLRNASRETPAPTPKAGGSVLKLFSFAGGGLLLLALSVFALWGTRSTATSATTGVEAAAPAQTNSSPTIAVEAIPTNETKPAMATPETTPGNVADTALEQLRQIRAAAADRSKVLRKLSETEMKYADDYRFPYERARVVLKDRKKNFEEEAFAALSRAAQKAINKGKAGEMLQSLNRDSEGDFQKLAHGHREWAQLQRALKSKNVSVLSATEGL